MADRGHTSEKVRLMPEIQQWQIPLGYVYDHDLCGLAKYFARDKWREGYAVPKFNVLMPLSASAMCVLLTFAVLWFADGLLPSTKAYGINVGDYRYFSKNGQPLWGIQIDVDKNQHTPFVRLRTIKNMVKKHRHKISGTPLPHQAKTIKLN